MAVNEVGRQRPGYRLCQVHHSPSQTGGPHPGRHFAHHSPLRLVDVTLEDFATLNTDLDEFHVPSTTNRTVVATLPETSLDTLNVARGLEVVTPGGASACR